MLIPPFSCISFLNWFYRSFVILNIEDKRTIVQQNESSFLKPSRKNSIT